MKFLFIIISLISFSAMAAQMKYDGVNEKGEKCELIMTDVTNNPNLVFIQVRTPEITSKVYANRDETNIVERTISHQGANGKKIKTTDFISVQLEKYVPKEFSISRKQAVKNPSMLSSYKANESKGNTDSTCLLNL